MLLSLALFFAPSADAMVVCTPVEVVDTSPSNGQEDVAIDGEIGLLLTTGCGDPLEMTVDLILNDEVVETFQFNQTFAHGNAYAALQPSADLLPNTSYSIEISAPNRTHGWRTEFVTGSNTLESLSGEISLQIDSAEWDSRDLRYRVHGTVEAVADPANLSTLHLVVDGEEDAFLASTRVSSEGGAHALSQWGIPANNDDVCFRALQRDGSGEIVFRSEPVCPEFASAGCQSLALAPTALSVLWLPTLALVRRRRS